MTKYPNPNEARRLNDQSPQEDCKVAFLTAKDAKSAKEMLAMDIYFLGVFLGALGVLGGSLYPKRLCSSPATLPLLNYRG